MMIYFDNAATSFPKPRTVINTVTDCIKKYCGNPGRSAHKLAIKSSEKIFEARDAVCSLIGFDSPENVVFTLNATYALNTAIKTSLKKGDHVITSDIEHNSVIRPLESLVMKNEIAYDVIRADKDLIKEVEDALRPNTSTLIFNLASNVTGEEISLKTLYKIKQKYNLKLIVDASQFIGHAKIDINETPFDILCAPSHKGLFGIQGAGFCVFRDSDELDSFIEGGSGSESLNPHMPKRLPEHFEAGTLPTPAIASLASGIEFINKIGINEIHSHTRKLGERAMEILSAVNKVKTYSSGSGIISFTHSDIPSAFIADKLNSYGICVRSGLHCAPLIHKRLGTAETGTVRLSFSYFNKIEELDVFYKALKDICAYQN